MYITSIKLKNIKCFEELEYDFEHQDGASLVIAGDNGDGKSTILRSIAISLCDQWTAAGLLRELSGEFVRTGEDIDDGTITLKLQDGGSQYIIRTVIRWNDDETYEYPTRIISEVRKGRRGRRIPDDKFPWKDIFATGYGAGLRTSGTEDFQYYFTGDSIYSLFRDDVSLQNPELAIRRITAGLGKKKLKKLGGKSEAETVKAAILTWLREILILKDRTLSVEPNGIYISDKNRTNKTALAASGDGYKALTALVLDMLAWWFLNRFYDAEKAALRGDRKISVEALREIKGIVIIDELEQHLHPKWQQEILPALKNNFSKVQFIVATHSPLVISAAKTPILVLGESSWSSRELFGWRAEDIYREMGVERTSRPKEMMEELRRFDALYQKQLAGTITPPEKRSLSSLEKRLLRNLPETDPAVETIRMIALTKKFNSNAKRKKN